MKHPDYEPKRQRVGKKGASMKHGLAFREVATQPRKDSCKHYGKKNHFGGSVHDVYFWMDG